MLGNYEKSIRDNYTDLVERITAESLDDIIRKLYEIEQITAAEKESIQQRNETRSQRVDRFLEILLKKSDGAYECFLKGLTATGYSDLANQLLPLSTGRDQADGQSGCLHPQVGTNNSDTVLKYKPHIKFLCQQSDVKHHFLSLARALELHDIIPDLEQCLHKSNYENAITKMLENWCQRNGSQATVRKLADILEEEKLVSIREGLLQL